MYTVKLDKVRELKFNFSSLMYLQKRFGKTEIEDILNSMNNEIPPLELIPILLYCGLKHYEDINSEDDIVKLLDKIKNMHLINELIITANKSFEFFFNFDSKNESSPKATKKIPTKRKKKNGAGGDLSDKPQKSA